MKFARHLAAALLLAGPGIALAQSVPFQTIGQGAMGPFGAPANKVIRTAQEFHDSGLEQYTDPAALIAPIDWSQEMVIAVLMGTKSNGGYGTSVDSIEIKIHTPTPPPGPPHPPPLGIPTMVVSIRERVPGPGAIVPMVITSPYHLVRVRRHSPVAFQVLPQPPAAVFERASLSYESGPIGGTGDNLLVEVEKDGSAVVVRSSTTAHYQPIYGQATSSELQALEQAIRNARLASLPEPIPAGVVFVVQPPGFSLYVISGRPELAGNKNGTLGFYGNYDGRVRPLVDAFKAIGDRLMSGSTEQDYSGVVELPPGGGIRLIDGAQNYRLSPPATASDLAQFRGHTVRVRGTLVPGPQGDTVLEVSSVLSPQHLPLDGVAQLINGRAELLVGSPFQHAPLQRVRTFGAAARTLRLAVGNMVHCDAYVFTDASGLATEARIDSIEGSMKRRAYIFDSGFVGIAQKDEGIHLLALSSSGAYTKIKAQAGIGWVQTNRVLAGTPFQPLPAPTPLTSAGSTNGLIGAIPGN